MSLASHGALPSCTQPLSCAPCDCLRGICHPVDELCHIVIKRPDILHGGERVFQGVLEVGSGKHIIVVDAVIA